MWLNHYSNFVCCISPFLSFLSIIFSCITLRHIAPLLRQLVSLFIGLCHIDSLVCWPVSTWLIICQLMSPWLIILSAYVTWLIILSAMSHWFIILLAFVTLTHYSVSFCYLDSPYVTLGLSYVISVCLMSLLCHLASHYPNSSRISRIVSLWFALSRIFLHFSHIISHFLVFWSISSLYFLLFLFPVHAHDYYWTVYLPCAHYILLRTLDPESKSYFVFIGSYRSLT